MLRKNGKQSRVRGSVLMDEENRRFEVFRYIVVGFKPRVTSEGEMTEINQA